MTAVALKPPHPSAPPEHLPFQEEAGRGGGTECRRGFLIPYNKKATQKGRYSNPRRVRQVLLQHPIDVTIPTAFGLNPRRIRQVLLHY